MTDRNRFPLMAKTDQSLKVFISYARKDGSAFAEELVEALDVAGFDAFLDRNDIAAGEDWEKRLEAMLAAADTVVFVMTPGSVASERCRWEIDTATALSKRIIPVVAVETPEGEVPPTIARLNYIFFTRGLSFARALKQLATALTSDATWIREHTRIAELADRWMQRGRPDVLLLRGPELEAASLWLAAATDNGPQPTDLQRSFLDASAHYEHAQANLEAERLAAVGVEQAAKEAALKRLSLITRGGLAVSGLLLAAAIGLAFWSINAEGRFREAQQLAAEAQANSIDAEIAGEAQRTDITGQLIAYATARTDIRLGAEARTLFTASATTHLVAPNTSLLDGFMRAQEEMRGNRTAPRPLLSTSLNGDLYLGRPAATRKLEALVVTAGSADDDDSDADAWEAMLREAGFDVHRLLNPTKAQFDKGLADFVGQRRGENSFAAPAQISPSQVEVSTGPEANTLYFFVFVGQAASSDGQNWLGFSNSSAADFEGTAVRVDAVAAALAARAAASVLVINAPFTLDTGGVTLRRNS